MTNTLTTSFFACEVKKDGMVFISFKLTFLGVVSDLVLHCIFLSKSTPRYLTLSFLSSGVSEYLTVSCQASWRCALFQNLSVFVAYDCHFVVTKPMINQGSI